MPKKYTPLTPSEVISILEARGITYSTTVGSHAQYECVFGGKKRKVTVDLKMDEFDDTLLKSMISQSGMTREQFYCSTKRTAAKINMKKNASL